MNVEMTSEGENKDSTKRPRLVLLKGQQRRSGEQEGEQLPALRLIDCRPNLNEAFRRMRWRAPLREHVERLLGRVSARVAEKLRR